MKIAIAADHAGYPLKQHLIEYLSKQGHEILDLGTNDPTQPDDYPDFSEAIGIAVRDGKAERGILACGSGVGASIAANKIKGVYCAVCHDHYSAHQGVEHDRMNILAIGARIIGPTTAEELADAFIAAVPSTEERHVRRFRKVQAIEARGE